MNTKSFSAGLLSVVVALIFCTSAEAEISNLSYEHHSNGINTIEAEFRYDMLSFASILSFTEVGTSNTDILFTIDGDTNMRFQKVMHNYTDRVWTGYKVTLDGELMILPNSVGSSAFNDFVIDGNTITFSDPTAFVDTNGGQLSIGFDITIFDSPTPPPTNTGSFNQADIILSPEPSTILLLSFAALAARRRKRKNH